MTDHIADRPQVLVEFPATNMRRRIKSQPVRNLTAQVARLEALYQGAEDPQPGYEGADDERMTAGLRLACYEAGAAEVSRCNWRADEVVRRLTLQEDEWLTKLRAEVALPPSSETPEQRDARTRAEGEKLETMIATHRHGKGIGA